ncbi:SGS-domain-containing protein [Acrodontium crateriforme]|uniref:SGS-domain-containing protein n=1 Tax=Acrodontium crateriforme TaxID=150365 RepID=A0AAQ3RBP6_9PEZI|nr:SGS-domain-containing protein [Acrodontium crateriforme]
MATQADLGKKALLASDYEEAIKQYTAALKVSPTSPDYLIQRSTAYQRAKKLPEALSDANRAVVNAKNRGKKEAIIDAQFRRGSVLYTSEKYGDAAFVFEIVKKLNNKHKQLDLYLNMTANAIKKLPEDDEKRVCTVKEVPDVEAIPSEESSVGSSNTPTNSAPAVSAAPQPTAADKIRYDWYQNTQNVYFTLLAKGVPKEKAEVEITERSLTISFPTPSGADYNLTLEPLFAAVKPADCITRILPTKVEIILVKNMTGQKWAALESSEPVEKGDSGNEASKDDLVRRAIFTDTKPEAPAYPTSSRTGPKNWDAIHLDDDDDDFGGDEGNKFFKKLFKDASPEVQRAMMKSYTESNGTALSTNWDEVSKGPVETLPPDGMEARKWSS